MQNFNFHSNLLYPLTSCYRCISWIFRVFIKKIYFKIRRNERNKPRASEGLITCSRTCNKTACALSIRGEVTLERQHRDSGTGVRACSGSGEIAGARSGCCCRSRLAGRSSGAHFRTAHRYGLLFSREEVSVVRIYS